MTAAITTLPPAPSRADAPADFIAKADALVAALSTMVAEINATAAGYGADLWVSGSTYAQYARVYSPTDLQTYRRVTAGSGTTDPVNDSTNWARVVDPGDLEPMNVNPYMAIDQVNEGSLYTVSSGTQQALDGWSGIAAGTGAFKLRRLADPDNAAGYCMEITCTSADASIGSTDFYAIKTAVEGYDAAILKAGTSAAEAIGIKLKLKTSLTGTYGVAVQNGTGNRRNVGTIVVSGTGETEYFVTMPMDTSGTWLYTNGVGLSVFLTLAAGSSFQASSGSWGAGAETTTSAQANFMSSTSNVAYLKSCFVFRGSTPRPNPQISVQRQLARCQRYYAKSYEQGTAVGAATAVGITGPAIGTAGRAYRARVNFPVTLRAAPTISYWDSAGTSSKGSQSDDNSTTTWTANLSVDPAPFQASSSGFYYGSNGVSVGVWLHYSANARLS